MIGINKTKLRKTRNQKSLFANQDIKKGDVIIKFKGKILNYPKITTLQIGENRHLDIKGTIGNHINHSCNPNCYINSDNLTLRAVLNYTFY